MIGSFRTMNYLFLMKLSEGHTQEMTGVSVHVASLPYTCKQPFTLAILETVCVFWGFTEEILPRYSVIFKFLLCSCVKRFQAVELFTLLGTVEYILPFTLIRNSKAALNVDTMPLSLERNIS